MGRVRGILHVKPPVVNCRGSPYFASSRLSESKKAARIPVIASVNCTWSREWASFAKELERAFQGQQTAAQALAAATTRGNVVLRNFERANRG
mgnify:CR=1 FL=1